MPDFDRRNLPRALYIALYVPQIIGEDIVKYGLATHYVEARKIDQMKAELSLKINRGTSKAEIEVIIDKYASLKYSTGLIDLI